MTSSYVYTLPSGPTAELPFGTTPGQMLYWNGENWVAFNYSYFDGSAMGLGFNAPPSVLPFGLSLNVTAGPVSDNLLNLGDATHRFDTLFASHISGFDGFLNLWGRTGTTVSPTSPGDNITTSGNISTTGAGVFVSQSGMILAGGASPLMLNGNSGSTDQVLISKGPGMTPAWQTLSTTIGFANITSGLNTSATMAIGQGASLLASGGDVEATIFKAAGSTTNAVDLATSEVSGTLGISNGGTGGSTAAEALTNLLPSQTGNATKVLGTDGSTATWVSTTAGTVTSVGLSAPAEFTVSNSPITSSGSITLSKANQIANTIYAGPTTGAAGVPLFRALVSADIPDNASNTTGTAANVTDVVDVANGGTNATNGTDARTNLGAAASGANADITSLSGITTALPVPEGGTGLNTLSGANRLLYSSSATALTTLAPGNTNDVLTLSSSGAPTWSPTQPTTSMSFAGVQSGTNTNTLTIGSGGAIFLDGSGVVEASKLKGGGSTTDAVDLATTEVAGMLGITNGGTGSTTASGALTNLLPSQTGNATKVLGTNGSTAAWVSPPTGTVTSVGLSAPAEFTVSNSPITSSGSITLSKANQTANTIYAGPTTGAADVPVFRALVSADIPDNASNTTGTAANVTDVVAVANGGTNATNGTDARANLGAAASGVNGDITSLTGLTTALPVGEGGTGAATTSANTVFAGPDGSTGAPSFRVLTANDIPSLASTYITNTTSQQASSNFNISGNGVIGSRLGIGAPSPNEALEVKDGNVLLSNTGTPKQLQLQGTSSGITTFKAGAQGATTINYTLPTSQGGAGTVLTNDGSGALSWGSASQVGFGRRVENFDVTSTSLQSDTSLVISLAANATYTFTAFLSVSEPTATGLAYRFAFAVPSGATLKWGMVDPTQGLSTNGVTKSGSGTESSTVTLSGSSEWDVWVQGIVVTSAFSGPLQLRFRKVSGGAATDPVRLNINSFIQATRVQ